MIEQLKILFAQLSWRQRLSILAVVAAVSGGLYWLQQWNHDRGFQPLYSGLAPADAGAITTELEAAAVEYRLEDGGATILVRQEQVAQLRLNMASAGLPESGRIGYELFDQTNFGASEFTEQVNYHRALEGELERSVMSIAEVERARVHLTLPKESLYTQQREPAKASILVKLRARASLTPANIAAITHLAASAVPGLKPNQVTLLDTEGNLLNQPRPTGMDGGEDSESSQAAMDYRKSIEKEIQAKVAATVEPLLGPEHYRISVSADLDRTSGEQSEEVFDPDRSVIASSQSTQDIPTGVGAVGTPGTPSNLPRSTAGAVEASSGITQMARRTEATTFQTSRTVRHTLLRQGKIERLSLSVLVDHTLRYENGQPVIEPPAPEKLQVIQDLVSAAVGLDTERGDRLVVEAFPFETTLAAQPIEPLEEPAPQTPSIQLPSWLANLIGDTDPVILVGAAGGGALLVLGAGLFWWRRGIKKRQTVELKHVLDKAEQEKLNAVQAAGKQVEAKLAGAAAEHSRKEAEALLSMGIPQVSTKKTDILTKHIRTETEKDPAALAQVIRSWLNGEYQR